MCVVKVRRPQMFKTLNYFLLLLLISHLFQDFCLLCFFLCKLGDTPSQWEIEETVRFKELYDQDKDGRLNRDEQLRWVAPNSYGSAREEVRFTYYMLFEVFVDMFNKCVKRRQK